MGGVYCGILHAAIHLQLVFLNRAVFGPSNVVCDAERRKICKYSSLLSTYIFFPIAVETLGAFGTEAMSFLHEVGRRIQFVTHEKRSFSFLMQCLSNNNNNNFLTKQ